MRYKFDATRTAVVYQGKKGAVLTSGEKEGRCVRTTIIEGGCEYKSA